MIPHNNSNHTSDHFLHFEKELLLTRCGNKKDLMLKLVTIVLEDIPKQLEKLHSSVQEKNTEALYKTAHKIKGTSLNMGFPKLKESAEKLEKSGRSSSIITTEITDLIHQLQEDWKTLQLLLLAV